MEGSASLKNLYVYADDLLKSADVQIKKERLGGWPRCICGVLMKERRALPYSLSRKRPLPLQTERRTLS